MALYTFYEKILFLICLNKFSYATFVNKNTFGATEVLSKNVYKEKVLGHLGSTCKLSHVHLNTIAKQNKSVDHIKKKSYFKYVHMFTCNSIKIEMMTAEGNVSNICSAC